ncbi:DUF308 domain-containing protein [Rugosimonospora africana]|uniref:DUF308 domain-containing protein n=1 Tax=Rugosimonospora africana TaxID=556532 RepID=A0A8J3QXH8_9ACTN|nr:DUF308 domain-containing protein [Rugosimonospora africana]GIH18693.1 hypothetical protein Raf01_68650 [Rugosimonospora africana]
MTSGGARRGRRDNGLVAAAYAAAGDVDPRVGEHLLDVLGLRGIAAYLQPASDLHPVTRTTTLPSRPTDRLYVDRAHLETAREYLAQLGPDAPPAAQHSDQEVDEAFAEIIAGFDLPDESVSWPAVEDLPSEREEEPEQDRGAEASAGATPPALQRWSHSTVTTGQDEPSLLDGLDALDSMQAEDEEGYTPPPPPPLPRFAPVTILAVAGILVGVVLLFDPGLLPTANSVAMTLGFCGILAGFITLIWRLRSGDDDDDWDPDDGAVV